MATFLGEILSGCHKIIYQDNDPRTNDWPIASSPTLVVAIVIIYVQFVTKWGPAFMKRRTPFKLGKLIQAHNIFQIIACSYMVYVGYTHGFGPSGGYQFWCEPVDYSNNEISTVAVRMGYTYFLVKIADLFDTVFFVLRKKTSQVTFLHVYHHAGQIIATWIAFRYIAGGSTTMIAWVNSIVHVFMYTYYFLTSWNPKLKNNVWWKKYITQIQIVQFLFFAVYAIKIIISPSCGYPKLVMVIFLPQNLFFLKMFLEFYKKNYFSKSKE